MKTLRVLAIAALTLIVGVPILFAAVYAVSETIEQVGQYQER